MVAPSKLAHVVYATHNFDAMIDWYTKALEARVIHNNGTLAFLTWDEEHHRVAIANLGPAPDDEAAGKGRVGVHHVAYTWDSLDNLLTTYERLRDLDITPVVKLRHGMTLSMYYADPDGNRSEFQIDVLGIDPANDFMAGPAFEANPIGEEFDPEELLAAYRAGDDVTELLFRSDQEPVPVAAMTAGTAAVTN